MIITGYGTIESAVDAIKKGAFDYILKPFDNDEILRRPAGRSRSSAASRTRTRDCGRPWTASRASAQIIGRSPRDAGVVERIRTVATTDARVLIQGETGTGKERVARAIHDISRRAKRARSCRSPAPRCPSRCSRPSSSGTSAARSPTRRSERRGRFELADGGTLFLDDIDDMPLAVQVKLLRVLQEREVERLGSAATRSTSTSACRRDQGGPARARARRASSARTSTTASTSCRSTSRRCASATATCRCSSSTSSREHGRGRAYDGVARRHGASSCAIPWPGNVRELENAVERAVALAGPRDELTRDTCSRRPRAGAPRRRRARRRPVPTLREVLREAESRRSDARSRPRRPPRERGAHAGHLPQGPVGEDEGLRRRVGVSRATRSRGPARRAVTRGRAPGDRAVHPRRGPPDPRTPPVGCDPASWRYAAPFAGNTSASAGPKKVSPHTGAPSSSRS